MAEFEFGGMTFRGGKMFAVLTALSTLGGAAWAGFEFYKDYMDMKEIVQNINIDEIAAANALQLQKLEDAIGYTQDIKDDLKGDLARIESYIDTLEENVVKAEDTVRNLRVTVNNSIDDFSQRLRVELKENTEVLNSLRDRINTNIDDTENRIKTTQGSIESTLEGIRNEMNELQKDVTKSIREVEATVRESEKDVRDVMKSTTAELESKMDKLDGDIRERIQEAFDNPLAN